jgi:hypothetical protein
MEEQAKPIATLLQIATCKEIIQSSGYVCIFLDE